LDQQLGRKSVREHQRLGAAVGRGGEQLKGAATVGLGAAATAVRGGMEWAVVVNRRRQDTTRPGLLDGGSHRRANTRPILWRLKCEKTFPNNAERKRPRRGGA